MLFVREDICLMRQGGASRLDCDASSATSSAMSCVLTDVDARKAMFLRDLLRAQVFFDLVRPSAQYPIQGWGCERSNDEANPHRQWIVRATLHRRVVYDYHAFPSRDTTDTRDDPGAWDAFGVYFVRGESR